MRRAKQAGFTLLELLVVVIIIGILATVALPQFGKAMRSAKSSEAVNTVGSLLTAEWAYYQEKGDRFATAISELLAEIPTDSKFTYAPTGGGAGGGPVTITATPRDADVSGITITGSIGNGGGRTITKSL